MHPTPSLTRESSSRERSQQGDRLRPWLRHHAVADPHRIEQWIWIRLYRHRDGFGPGCDTKKHAALRNGETEIHFAA